MKNSFATGLLILLLVRTSGATGIESVRDLEWKMTPVFALAVAEEQRFRNAFPFLYMEDEGDAFDYERSLKFYNLALENDPGACAGDDQKIIDFCRFYQSVTQNEPGGADFDPFLKEGGVIRDLALLGKSLSAMMNGNAAAAIKLNEAVESGTVRTYFRNYLGLYDASRAVTVRPADFYGYTRLYMAASRDVALFNEQIPPDPYGYLDFLQGKLYFYKKNYELSANYFMRAARNDSIKEVALENAVRAFFNGRNFKKVRESLRKVENRDFRNAIDAMVKLENRKLDKVPPELLKDSLFSGYLLAHAKESALKGASLGFLKGIDDSVVNEDLMFFICVAGMAGRESGETLSRCFGRAWSERRYAALMSVLAEFSRKLDVTEADEQAIKVMDEYRLYAYYPASYIYGQMNFIAGEQKKAQRAYEIVLRNRHEYTQEQIEKVYYNLAVLYRDKGSYYTSVKLLEEALPQISHEKQDLFRIEIVRILVHRGDWEEALWRAEKLFNDTASPSYKKELLNLIEICYENLDKPKPEEKP